jgi:hypothetical protein
MMLQRNFVTSVMTLWNLSVTAQVFYNNKKMLFQLQKLMTVFSLCGLSLLFC